MPTYEWMCKFCGEIREVVAHIADRNIPVTCKCGQDMQRAFLTPPMIAGDTVAGGCNYTYYDEALGCAVHGRRHRREIMNERGLDDYSPDEATSTMLKENAYIRKHSQKSAEQRAATKAVGKAAQNKRRKKIVSETLRKAKKEIFK